MDKRMIGIGMVGAGCLGFAWLLAVATVAALAEITTLTGDLLTAAGGITSVAVSVIGACWAGLVRID